MRNIIVLTTAATAIIASLFHFDYINTGPGVVFVPALLLFTSELVRLAVELVKAHK